MQANSKINRRHVSSGSLQLTVALACLSASTSLTMLPIQQARAADDAGCAPVLKAQDALRNAPMIHETVKSGSRAPMVMIVTPTRMYHQEPDGSWTYAEFSMATRNKMVHMVGKGKLSDCRLLRSEKMDGQTADVYSVTADPRFGKKNTVTIWVSRASGLPLKTEGDVHRLFGGAAHMVEQFAYHDVQVPANAKEEINMNHVFGHH